MTIIGPDCKQNMNILKTFSVHSLTLFLHLIHFFVFGEGGGLTFMHMRKKKWARPELEACPYFIAEPEPHRNHWRELFANNAPLHLEFGCGKGVSTAQMIHDNPQINYIAIDISPDVLGDARRNIEQVCAGTEASHTLLCRCDLARAGMFFGPDDHADRIILSFSNPWPKRKHEKRRLTHPRELMQYRSFLAEHGEIFFKTDDKELWEDSQVYFYVCGYTPVYLTDDLHSSGYSPNYVSEHELRFAAEGKPIHFGIYQKTALEHSFDPNVWQMPNRQDLPKNLFGPF